jgi:hypothetical protein
MARPKRMGVYNALDDLLPGPAWGARGDEGTPAWDPGPAGPDDEPAPPRRPRLEPVRDPPRFRRRPRDRQGGNALDDLLPGPAGESAGRSLPAVGRRPTPRRSRPGPQRHLGVWNPLDGPPPPPAPSGPDPVVPAKVRVGFRLPADVLETARDAVAHLAGTGDRTTLTALAERALRVELARLAITHNDGRPFPPRQP